MRLPIIERYFGKDCLIPELCAIGFSRQIEARTDLLPHHERYFEIHLVSDGVLHWWVEDEIYHLPPNSVYITKPGELHGGMQNTVQPSSLMWLQVDPECLDESLCEGLFSLNLRTWLGADLLVPLATEMLEEIRQPQADSARMLSALLELFLSKLLRQQQAATESSQKLPKSLQQLLQFIDDELKEGHLPRVTRLCEMLGLSRSRLFQLFECYLGQSPMNYVKGRRLEQAKNLLKTTELSITQIAMELGFASSQHFATQFKKQTGMTPKHYRQAPADTILPEQKSLGKQNYWGHQLPSKL
ncbi:MAG: AraC family transcriptional regulator [Deinococcales bacterium]